MFGGFGCCRGGSGCILRGAFLGVGGGGQVYYIAVFIRNSKHLLRTSRSTPPTPCIPHSTSTHTRLLCTIPRQTTSTSTSTSTSTRSNSRTSLLRSILSTTLLLIIRSMSHSRHRHSTMHLMHGHGMMRYMHGHGIVMRWRRRLPHSYRSRCSCSRSSGWRWFKGRRGGIVGNRWRGTWLLWLGWWSSLVISSAVVLLLGCCMVVERCCLKGGGGRRDRRLLLLCSIGWCWLLLCEWIFGPGVIVVWSVTSSSSSP
mmetsp:Transcript_26791/g.39969  ORF Transcript_26791/g.39969 Transcript_26791/m.39969 type:complete len:256 (+) Transcript_26791:3570-4337(+)